MARPRVYPDDSGNVRCGWCGSGRRRAGVTDGGYTAISRQLGIRREPLRQWVRASRLMVDVRQTGSGPRSIRSPRGPGCDQKWPCAGSRRCRKCRTALSHRSTVANYMEPS